MAEPKTIPKPPKEPTKELKPAAPSKIIIERTIFPKWWKELGRSIINNQGVGRTTLVPFGGGQNKWLVSLFFVADGETDITLMLGGTPISGPMSFGGPDEPRGMTLDLSSGPIPCGNEILTLYQDPVENETRVSGTAVYLIEPKQEV